MPTFLSFYLEWPVTFVLQSFIHAASLDHTLYPKLYGIESCPFRYLFSPVPIVYSWHFFTAIEAVSDGFEWGGLKWPPQPLDTSIALGKTNGADPPIHLSIYDQLVPISDCICQFISTLSRPSPHLWLAASGSHFCF